jgi:hypothetical protein
MQRMLAAKKIMFVNSKYLSVLESGADASKDFPQEGDRRIIV